MDRVLGGHPLAVLVRLVIVSCVVGIVLQLLGLSPFTLFDSLRDLIERIYHAGWDAFGWLLRYVLLGAVVVVPLWLIGRIWHLAARSGSDRR